MSIVIQIKIEIIFLELSILVYFILKSRVKWYNNVMKIFFENHIFNLALTLKAVFIWTSQKK